MHRHKFTCPWFPSYLNSACGNEPIEQSLPVQLSCSVSPLGHPICLMRTETQIIQNGKMLHYRGMCFFSVSHYKDNEYRYEWIYQFPYII